VSLYNHQIPPGAADVVHYRLRVPEGLEGELTVRAALHYRKFDATLLAAVEGADFDGNDLPIVTLGSDAVAFPVVGRRRTGAGARTRDAAVDAPQRLRYRRCCASRERRQLRQAEASLRPRSRRSA
jgi:hypothetical protein